LSNQQQAAAAAPAGTKGFELDRAFLAFMGSAAGLFGHTEFFGVFQNIPKFHKFIAKFGIFK